MGNNRVEYLIDDKIDYAITVKNKIDIYSSENKYDIILADPPWRISKGGKKNVRPNSSGKPLDYKVESLDVIQNILKTATDLANENSILFLWAIDKYLFEAETIGKQLGYKLHARIIACKNTGIPAAFTLRFGHEYLLYMYRGKLLPVAKECRGKYLDWFPYKVTKHSEKPLESYELIKNLYPNQKKLELFARRVIDGFDGWGNEY